MVLRRRFPRGGEREGVLFGIELPQAVDSEEEANQSVVEMIINKR